MLRATLCLLAAGAGAGAGAAAAAATTTEEVVMDRKTALALRAKNVSNSSAPYFPYNSVEDFFENAGLDVNNDMVHAGVLKCSTSYQGGRVYVAGVCVCGESERVANGIRPLALSSWCSDGVACLPV